MSQVSLVEFEVVHVLPLHCLDTLLHGIPNMFHHILVKNRVTAAYSLGPASASEDSFSSKYRFHLQVLE
ncbi:hypothetical protein GQ457_12G028210 [Hibiscus cannabinus]